MPYEEAIEKMNEWDKWLELAFVAGLFDDELQKEGNDVNVSEENETFRLPFFE